MSTLGTMAQSTATVVIADDHAVTRQGVRDILATVPEFQVVAGADNGADAVDLAARWRPDVLILDISMPGMNGIEAAKCVRERCSKTRVVMLSMHDEDTRVFEALRAGAMAYVLKQDSLSDVLAAVRAVLQNQYYFSPSLSARAVQAYAAWVSGKTLNPYDGLSPREREALLLRGEGLTCDEIAHRMNVSLRAVKYDLERAMDRLDLKTLADVIRYTRQVAS